MRDVRWVFDKIDQQKTWRSKCINLIASENTTSSWVEKAYLTDFMHRYAEGTPFNRYYQGTEIIDEIEDKANKFFARRLGVNRVDVRPVSGAIANMAVMRALTNPGDVIAGLSVSAGAHSSHTKGGVAGLLGLNQVQLAFNNNDFSINTELSSKIIRHAKPKLAIIGASLILFPLDIAGIKEACDDTKCTLIYDAAHVFGMIFSRKFQQPFKEGAEILTTSTHKSFPGPQGGLIAAQIDEDSEWSTVQRGVFPKILSNHHLHRIPAVLVTAYEMVKFGDAYSEQILKNAKALAEALHEEGLNVCAEDRGFTESHQVVIDVKDLGGGKLMAEALEKANIILNKNLLPWDKLSLVNLNNPSGLRLGVPEMTRFGMKQEEMGRIAELIARVTIKKETPAKVKSDVEAFRKDFQKVHYTWDTEWVE
ncbi:MAG: serine hydroxymethyltransferase [Candidatus Altiarchaeota archaeon]|nr:serine hydroxymethyltransferase [Candidatus Altiarchaeota archaeon]